jgi:YHS domain-containing protein
MAKDLVCGKEIDEAEARQQTGQTLHGASEVDPQMGTRRFHNGQWYYFCGLECRTKFMASPETYLERS